MRLYPTDAINPAVFCANRGEMYYDDSDNQIYICDGANWQISSGAWALNGSDLYANSINWNVGIGTMTPEFKLSIDNDGGIIAKGAINSGASLATAGAGTRLIWYPRKAAFRAGVVSGGQWDDANIGMYSTAMGLSTVASGIISTAMGYQSTASGQRSTAMGHQSTASGEYSTAMGYNSTASGSISTAMGYNTVANQNTSTAMGDSTTASGNCSIAMGFQSTASGYCSIATGCGIIASGDSATAMGRATTASGRFTTAMGYRAKAIHTGSFVWADSQFADYSSTADDQFRVRASGGIWHGGAQVHDIAELMDVFKKENVNAAEIVSVVANDKLGKSVKPYDDSMIGVITGERTCTFYLGNENPSYEDTIRLPVALVGKVYVKVSSDSGPINIGAPITSSSSPGIGMKAIKAGKIIGYAMEEEDFQDKKLKEILVFVNVCYYVPPEKFRELFSMFEGQQKKIQELERKIEDKK